MDQTIYNGSLQATTPLHKKAEIGTLKLNLPFDRRARIGTNSYGTLKYMIEAIL